ncbi:Rv1535 domain-containing protein [Mycobacterium haemophilum]|uniref:Rv1535 domain-containing protein n=1 Tax=Mycobacterium haemophilum TaxID=29311 RepID=UPI001F1DE94C|nr:Rv1535 domain-containing protein [Mycobacterium haemophilum]
MSSTDGLADPLVSSVARVLNVPLLQLYALLWRVGVVQIVQTDRVRVSRGMMCPDPSAHCLEQPRQQLRQQRLPGPAPTPAGPAECSRVAG